MRAVSFLIRSCTQPTNEIHNDDASDEQPRRWFRNWREGEINEDLPSVDGRRKETAVKGTIKYLCAIRVARVGAPALKTNREPGVRSTPKRVVAVRTNRGKARDVDEDLRCAAQFQDAAGADDDSIVIDSLPAC